MKIKPFFCIGMSLLFFALPACDTPAASSSLQSAPSSQASSLPFVSSQVAVSQEETLSSAPSAESAIAFDAEEMWQEPFPAGLIRGWYGDVVVGSGHAERYLFQEDGTFYFNASGYDATNRCPYMDGEWYYSNGVVHLTIKRKIIIEGGEVVTGQDALPLEEAIIGGEYVQVALPKGSYETMYLPLEIIMADEELENIGIPGSIMLGDLQLYAKGGVGYEELLTCWDMYGNL